jgi:hypothetical protein
MTMAFIVNPMCTVDLHSYTTELGINTWNNQGWGRARLPTETIGNFTLTLTNVVVGSICETEVASTGTQIAIQTAATSTVVITIPVYNSGDAKNSIRIKVRKASASPFYQPYETQTTASISSVSIFVNQLSDES